MDDFAYLQDILNKVHKITEKKFKVENSELSIAMSIGASIYPSDAQTPEALLKCADEAMYRAKNSGKNKISFFQNDTKVYTNNSIIRLKSVNI